MYSFSSRVRYSEVDERGLLAPSALLSYLQDCVLFQSEELGAHTVQVRRRWLLAAWQVHIAELPRFTDEIIVSTWATKFSGPFGYRDFTLERAGERLVEATSLWFMYDDATGRPVRPPAEEVTPYEADLRDNAPLDLPPIQRKIPLPSGGEALPPVAVTQAYIDTNHHVNNAQYVGIALGAVPEPCRSGRLARLDVQYCTAARLGDVIYPRVCPAEDGAVVSLADDAGSPYAVVRAVFAGAEDA